MSASDPVFWATLPEPEFGSAERERGSYHSAHRNRGVAYDGFRKGLGRGVLDGDGLFRG
jgi:hypothetical protein